MSNSITITLQDVTFNYARIGRAFRQSFQGKDEAPMFNVQAVAAPGTDAYDTLKALVPYANVMEDEDTGSLVINLKQYTKTRSGQEQFLNVYDSNFNLMPQAQRERVGDGSRGHVVFYAYEHNNPMAEKPLATRMTDVVVTEVVEFTPMNGSINSLRGEVEQSTTTEDAPTALQMAALELSVLQK